MKRFQPHLYIPPLTPDHRLPPVLLDNFTGSGALTAHTPDIYPLGSAWAIISGTFGNLSAGFLPYGSGSFGLALINAGLADFELTWRAKHFSTAASLASGVAFRSPSASVGYKAGTYSSGGVHYIYCATIPGAVFVHADQTNANFYPQSLVNGSYYRWKMIFKGTQARLYNEAGELVLGWSSAARLTDTYVGPYCEQPYGNWDYLQVAPFTRTWIPFSVCGDSISTEWPGMVACRENNGCCEAKNHAAVGASVSANLSGQVTACISDNANFTIIALGTNDGLNFTATYQTQVERLWAALHKPIYTMGVLPKSDMAQRAIQNGYIVNAVNAAIANSVNVTYWNTDGWIDPATDTTDGLHPNWAGKDKITNQVLARI